MEYAILIGVLVFLAVMALYGYARGFVKIVLSMVAMIATLVLSALLVGPVSSVVKDMEIGESIRESVNEIVAEAEIVDTESIYNLDLPEALLDTIADGTKVTEDAIQDYVSEALTDIVITALTFLVLVIVIYIAIKIVITVLDVITKLPFLNGVNKSAGAVIGLIQGMIYVWIACLIVTAFGDKEWAQEVFAQINANGFLKFIYNNNMIIWLVTNLI